MYRLIACDMDETLLDKNAQVSKENQAVVRRLREQGVKFVLASGRGFLSMKGIAKILSLYDMQNEYTISFNGGVITENKDNRVISSNGISFTQMIALFYIGLQHDVGIHIYTIDNVYMYGINEDEKEYIKGRLDGYVTLSDTNVNFLSDHTIIKVLFHHCDRQYLESIKARISSDILSQFSICYSANRYLEFNQKGVSKGAALLKLMEKLNIKPENVMAIGDNDNDISMLKKAGLGIAVGNAIAEAKAAADYVCQATHEESVMVEIENVFFK